MTATNEPPPVTPTGRAPHPAARSLTERLGKATALDSAVDTMQSVVSRVRTDGARKVLSGEWMGHALHPLATDVVIGAWMSAAIVDLAGGGRSGQAADRLIRIGVLSAAPTIAAGWSDWLDAGARDREISRIGLVHATSNAAGLLLHVGSLRARRRGDRGRGKLLSLAGLGLVGVGGYLGGHLSYVHGARVERATGA